MLVTGAAVLALIQTIATITIRPRRLIQAESLRRSVRAQFGLPSIILDTGHPDESIPAKAVAIRSSAM
jgi:hypothetical protein